MTKLKKLCMMWHGWQAVRGVHPLMPNICGPAAGLMHWARVPYIGLLSMFFIGLGPFLHGLIWYRTNQFEMNGR